LITKLIRRYRTPLVSPLSPVITDLVMQDLEVRVLEFFKLHIPLL